MQDFVRKRIMLAKTWAKFERMELTDLRQSTSGISEANFSALKCGKMSVHAQMEIDTSVDVMLRLERAQNRKSLFRADRQLRRIALPISTQSSMASVLSRSLTKKATQVADSEFMRSSDYSWLRVPADEFLVSYYLDDQSSDEADPDPDSTRPWPRPRYQRSVRIIDGRLFCSCGFTRSMLMACRHI
jgi:hypothetical protein